MRNLQIDESQLIHEPDPFYPPASQKHQEAFQSFFTADSVDWDEFFTPSDFNVNGHKDRREHLYALGLKLANIYRQHFEDESGQFWEEA